MPCIERGCKLNITFVEVARHEAGSQLSPCSGRPTEMTAFCIVTGRQSEGGILSGLVSHFDLPESGFQVHHRKEPGSDHGFHSLLHAWKRVGILLGPSVESPEVDAEPESPIFLLDQNHCITPRRL